MGVVHRVHSGDVSWSKNHRKGHITRSIGGAVLCVYVPVPDSFDAAALRTWPPQGDVMKAYFAQPSRGQTTIALDRSHGPAQAGRDPGRGMCCGCEPFRSDGAKGYRDPRLPPDSRSRRARMRRRGRGGRQRGRALAVGDRVMGRCWGGFAEFALMKANLAMPVPRRLPWNRPPPCMCWWWRITRCSPTANCDQASRCWPTRRRPASALPRCRSQRCPALVRS